MTLRGSLHPRRNFTTPRLIHRIRHLPALALRFTKSDVARMWILNGLRLGNFLLVLPLALRTLPSDELGLWFVMLNLVFSANLLEFGLSSAIGRSASFFLVGSREFLRSGETPGFNDGQINHSGLAGLLAQAAHIFRWVALAGTVICATAFTWLSLTQSAVFLTPHGIGAFLLLSASVVFNLRFQFLGSILCGLHHVRRWQNAFIGNLAVGYAISLIGLWNGWGIVALAAGQSIPLILTPLRCRQIIHQQFPQIAESSRQPIDVRKLWAPAWRSGLITFGAWLSIHAMVPIAAGTLGLTVSATFSVSLQVILVANGLAISWLAVKLPQISSLIAAGKIQEARSLALTRFLIALVSYLGIGSVAAIVTPTALSMIGSQTTSLPIPLFLTLVASTAIEFITGCTSALLVAANSVKHYPAYVISGIVAAVLGLAFAQHWGVLAIVLAPAVGQLALNFWWTPHACWRLFNGRT